MPRYALFFPKSMGTNHDKDVRSRSCFTLGARVTNAGNQLTERYSGRIDFKTDRCCLTIPRAHRRLLKIHDVISFPSSMPPSHYLSSLWPPFPSSSSPEPESIPRHWTGICHSKTILHMHSHHDFDFNCSQFWRSRLPLRCRTTALRVHAPFPSRRRPLRFFVGIT